MPPAERIKRFESKYHQHSLAPAGETAEAPPVADEARLFRGSAAIDGPDRAGNRNGTTVVKFFRSRVYQHSLAPAGIASSTISRFSFSSPFSVWTAEISMPQLS